MLRIVKMKKIGLIVVGAGAIAQRNAAEAASSGLVEIIGIYDTNHKVAREMANKFSTQTYKQYEQVLEEEKASIVLISTPHFLHKDQAVAAANAGKHILIEKPMANNLEEAKEIISACHENNVLFSVNYSFRYLPKIKKAKELVDKGALGKITGIQILGHQYKDPGYWKGARSNSPDDWRANKEKSGGGLLIMTTCHAIDYVYFITGLKATQVYSEYDTLNSSAEVEDILSVTFRMDNGAIGTHSASSIMRGTEQIEERIWGTKGTLIIKSNTIEYYSTRPIDGNKPGKMYKIKKFKNVSWTREWVIDFANALKNRKKPLISATEGWNNLAFIRAAYRSMETRTPVTVEELHEKWSE
ncbi:MAG: Gfo/Idh/MocA family protein [Candidatus Thorarchaeota archaeon]